MTTTPFLGCKISLISKSEIRYEGILYTIDPKESTIALAKVRSYGTEDRPAERQVPPRDEIFEYIIFRAGDIKDLIVDDPPASIAPGLADPAIIQAHSTSTSAAATFPSTSFPQMSTAIGSGPGQRQGVTPFGSGTSAIDSLSGAITAQSKASASVESRSRNSTPTNVAQHRQSPQQDAWNRDDQTSKHIPNKENQQRRNTAERGQQRRGGGGGTFGPMGGPHAYNQNSQNRRGSGPHNVRGGHFGAPMAPNNRFGGSPAYNRPFFQPRGNTRPQSRPQQQRGSQNRLSTRPPKESLKFDEDYDFDKANEDFKEMEEKMSNLKVDGQPLIDKTVDTDKVANEANVADGSTNGDKESTEQEQFYDKTKSFFDHISCESLEREKGNVHRIDWKAERKLNTETFGVPGGYRGRGFNRFYRGRGGYNRGYSRGYSRGGGGDGRRYAGPARNRT